MAGLTSSSNRHLAQVSGNFEHSRACALFQTDYEQKTRLEEGASPANPANFPMKFFAQSPLAPNVASPDASPFDAHLQRRQNPLWRPLLFGALSLTALALYFVWRPPAPMLWLKHTEHLDRNAPQIALTIDDSPHPLTTPLLLAALDHAGIKATFFSIGENLRLYPELAHRIVLEGHTLGNHSQPHHNLTTVNPQDYPRHIDAGFATIAGVEHTSRARTALFRPPGGGLNRAEMDYLYRRDYTLAWWSNNVGDWTSPPAWKIARGVEANLRAGDILLLHDGGTGTPQAIGAIAQNVEKRDLKWVVMPER